LNSIDELKPYDTVITEYRNLAYEYFEKKGIYNLDFVHVTGAAEVYGHIPNISAIVTLKTSGKTLNDNYLKILDTIFSTQACLIANRHILECKSTLIERFLQSMNQYI
jgi:ATP phosphoribosyltransferase